MTDNLKNTEALARSHGLEFTLHPGGHVQIKGHGVLVNYWPESKNRTAHVAGGPSVKHCNPYDAIKLCLSGGKSVLKVKATKNAPAVDFGTVHSNPAGVMHFYQGKTPPWEFPSKIMAQSDIMRVEAYVLRRAADQMDGLMPERSER